MLLFCWKRCWIWSSIKLYKLWKSMGIRYRRVRRTCFWIRPWRPCNNVSLKVFCLSEAVTDGCSAYSFCRSYIEEADDATDQITHLRLETVWCGSVCCSLGDFTTENGGIHEFEVEDLLGKPAGFSRMRLTRGQADVGDHLEHILASLDMYSQMTENLIDFSFNVRENYTRRFSDEYV